MKIHSDYPGGNIIIEAIDGDTVLLRQDQRGSTQPWFYWNFQVEGAAGRRVTFRFTDWDVIGVRGPAVRRNGTGAWTWLNARDTEPAFSYTFGPDEHVTRLAFCIPYLQEDLRAFLGRTQGIEAGTLCRTRQGRDVELLTLGPADAPVRVILTARTHACEAAANFVLEGVLSRLAQAQLSGVRVVAVPFVDKDGVENGDQGKQRDGHDHNRDFIPNARYVETAALMRFVADTFSPTITLDLHCPWIRSNYNEQIYIVGSNDPRNWQEQQRFGAMLEAATRGELPYRAADNLPFGVGWNTGSNYGAPDEKCSCGRWMAKQPHCRMTATIETPYANVRGVATSPDNLRVFGQCLAQAVLDYAAS